MNKPGCTIWIYVDGERLGPFCTVREAKRSVETCGGKIRLVPARAPGCTRAWDVVCSGDKIGDACKTKKR